VIVGGGISGLSLAHFARVEQRIDDVLVLEADEHAGGKIHSEWIDGFCCEWGPQGFLDNSPDTLDLIGQLGLMPSLVRADHASGDRFIVRDGVLRAVPLKPAAFLASRVLSFPGRLRVLLEPLQRRGPEEESVLAFATRRIGREAAEVLVDAMVTGVYAGDPATLSLPATFPKMRRMEADHGSLTRAMISKAREARTRPGGGAVAGPSGPGGTLSTLRNGMQQLTESLAASLGERVRLCSRVRAVERDADGFRLRLDDGSAVAATSVAVSVPPAAAAPMLEPLLGPSPCAALRAVPTVRVAAVMTGYRNDRPFAHPTRGFGFLVPGRERRKVLGSIFCHSTFPHEAPPGHALLRTLVGGARAPELLDVDDHELVRLVRRELAALLGGDPEPCMVRVVRHDEAIPQYTLGHLERLAAVDAAAAAVPRLYLLGNGLRGIAANACVSDARAAAARLARQ
jgi:oxygen-dependent protoporphyrinogen oxidase